MDTKPLAVTNGDIKMNNVFTKEWWKAAGIRAVRTFAQTCLSMLTVGQAFADVNWQSVVSIAGVAAVISILTSLAGLPEVKDEAEDR